MLEFLLDLRRRQSEHIRALLEHGKGNLAAEGILPERNFMTLSSGERRRLIASIALESCRAINEIRLVILDEPLTHLDSANIDHQLQIIHEIGTLPRPPSLVIISHHFEEELKGQLRGLTQVNL